MQGIWHAQSDRYYEDYINVKKLQIIMLHCGRDKWRLILTECLNTLSMYMRNVLDWYLAYIDGGTFRLYTFYNFLMRSITVSVYIVENSLIKPSTKKTADIENFFVPNNFKIRQRFLYFKF